jgi:Cdc6-like AAA superfamily ATPase
MGEADWMALRHELLQLFTPGAPIDEFALFAGRQDQIQRLKDTVFSKGRHGAVFGERGVGKTSLVSIFHLDLPRASDVCYIYVQCTQRDTFSSIWRRALKRMQFSLDGKPCFGDQLVGDEVLPDDVELVLANFGPNDQPIIVFDEFDRVKDINAKTAMSETIKQLSNSPTPCTVIIVGVADSVQDLVEQHQSLSRALVQVRMPRMNGKELRDIVASRLRRTPVKITDEALWRISYLASGLPFYSHALGQASALLAVKRHQLQITEKTANDAIPDCFADLDQTLIDAYVKATIETRKGNIFKHVLAACALAELDELGRFSAASVETILSKIIGREMKAPSFSFHLNELCSAERGLILTKSGSRSHFRFKFV